MRKRPDFFLFFSFFSFFGLLVFFSVFFEISFVIFFHTREDGNRGRARGVKSGSTELREIRTVGILFFFFFRRGRGDDDDFELFEKFARSFLEEKRSLAEGVFTSAFVSLLLLTMCLCRPWRLCFFLSLSLSLSFLLSFAHHTPPL